MPCCGEKRRMWLEERNSVTKSNEQNTNTSPETKYRPNRIYEYIGESAFYVKGIFTGKLYSFEKKGTKKQVNYFDSFALMAERDLKRVSKL